MQNDVSGTPNGQRRQPRFLITIDTEEDNSWAKPTEFTVRNVSFLPRFQALCEKHGLKPTYLTNYPMAKSPEFVAFGKDMLRRQTGEIGMHLHAWNTPPHTPLTKNDAYHHPYLIEFPEDQMRAQISTMTDLLRNTFSPDIVSHRAGRWAFDERYARILVDHGYRVDCSVTPHESWKMTPGDPNGSGGSDYTHFPETPYYLDLDDISKAGSSPLLEVPLSVLPNSPFIHADLDRMLRSVPIGAKVMRRVRRPTSKLVPSFCSLREMLGVVEQVAREGRSHVEFMTHSSELMPGGSPYFRSSASIEKLYRELDVLFEAAARACRAATLTEFHEECQANPALLH